MLEMTLRKVGSSLVVTVPAHIAKAYDFNDGDTLECKIVYDYGKPMLQYRKVIK